MAGRIPPLLQQFMADQAQRESLSVTLSQDLEQTRIERRQSDEMLATFVREMSVSREDLGSIKNQNLLLAKDNVDLARRFHDLELENRTLSAKSMSRAISLFSMILIFCVVGHLERQFFELRTERREHASRTTCLDINVATLTAENQYLKKEITQINITLVDVVRRLDKDDDGKQS